MERRKDPRRRRKLVLAPDGAEVITAPVTRHIDNAVVKAIARDDAGGVAAGAGQMGSTETAFQRLLRA